jgi:hypothetical protein
MEEEKVYVELTWGEYMIMLAAIQGMKSMVDNDALDALYIKLSTKYKGS